MKMSEYQQLAERTASSLKERDQRLANFGMGLSGEAGEVTDYLKKVIFHGHTLDEDKLIEELGDVLWYIAVLSNTIKRSLDEVAATNIEKLEQRYPEGFSKENSQERVDSCGA